MLRPAFSACRWRSSLRTVVIFYCMQLLLVLVCVPDSCPKSFGKHNKLALPQSSIAWAQSKNIEQLHKENLNHMIFNIIVLTMTIILVKLHLFLPS